MLNKRCGTLPKVNCRPFASEVVFFSHFEVFLSSLFTVPFNERTRVGSVFLNGSEPERFSQENRNVPLSKLAAERSKDSRFFSYLPIKNPSKRPGASP